MTVEQTMFPVEHCARCGGQKEENRQNQGYCKKCHAELMRDYRAKWKARDMAIRTELFILKHNSQ